MTPNKEEASSKPYPCPYCKTLIHWDSENPHRPFCSKRCQDADYLGWANEEHSIPAIPNEDIFE